MELISVELIPLLLVPLLTPSVIASVGQLQNDSPLSDTALRENHNTSFFTNPLSTFPQPSSFITSFLTRTKNHHKENTTQNDAGNMTHNITPDSVKSTNHRQQRKMSGFTGFPYKYEDVPGISKKTRGSLKQRKPQKNRGSKPAVVNKRIDKDDDIKHMPQMFDLRPIQDIFPIFGSQNQRPHVHQARPAFGFSTTELNFIGILAAIGVKLVMSTALATWFLVAGQTLYSIADATGTVAVFGQDSTIGYIYKTLPLIEALLRGETMFSHHR